MKNRSILAIILVAILLLCTVSCNNDNDTSAATTPPADTKITVCEGKNSSYQIVTAENNGGATSASMKIFMAMDTTFGVSLKRVTDTTAPSDYEIIVGSTNRYTPSPALAEKEYIICAKGKSIVIAAGSDRALTFAAERFVKEYVVKDADGNLTIPADLSIKDTADIPDEKTVKLKIGSYNIKNGELVNHDFTVLAKDILDNELDIVGFQEVDESTGRNKYQETMAILAEETGYDYYFAPAISYWSGYYGNGILSKYPIVSCETIKIPVFASKEEERCLLHAKIDVGGTILDFFVTHLNSDTAEKQLKEINKYTSVCDTFVLAGDYNYSNFNFFNTTFKNAQLAHTTLHTTGGGHQFDNFVISRSIKCENTRVVDTKHSDHYLLISDITIKFEVEK